MLSHSFVLFVCSFVFWLLFLNSSAVKSGLEKGGERAGEDSQQRVPGCGWSQASAQLVHFVSLVSDIRF